MHISVDDYDGSPRKKFPIDICPFNKCFCRKKDRGENAGIWTTWNIERQSSNLCPAGWPAYTATGFLASARPNAGLCIFTICINAGCARIELLLLKAFGPHDFWAASVKEGKKSTFEASNEGKQARIAKYIYIYIYILIPIYPGLNFACFVFIVVSLFCMFVLCNWTCLLCFMSVSVCMFALSTLRLTSFFI